MREIFFVLKTFIVTLVVVLLLQIKLGDDTLENRALLNLRESTAAAFLQEFGADGWAAFRKVAAKASHALGGLFAEGKDRALAFKLKRSQAYEEELAAKEEAAQERITKEKAAPTLPKSSAKAELGDSAN